MTVRPAFLRVALNGDDPVAAVPDALSAAHADHRERYATVLTPDWRPERATEFSGAVWPCLGSAVWAVRTTASYEEAIRAAIDLSRDTDTVVAVAGALTGAVCGIGAVPTRWTDPLHVPLTGAADPQGVLHLAGSSSGPEADQETQPGPAGRSPQGDGRVRAGGPAVSVVGRPRGRYASPEPPVV